MLDRYGASFEIKAVSAPERVITGYAAAFSPDRVADLIDRKAFDKTLVEKTPAAIGVFVAHDTSKLPIGVPLEVRVDDHGLFTKTRIFKTSAGDDLLATAAELLSSGQPLGMSIGYRARASRPERLNGKSLRRLLDIDLVEYSYAAAQTIANQDALTVAVKQEGAMPIDFSPAYVDALPDTAFAYVEPGGVLDQEGKTIGRSLRHFAHHATDGAVDPDQLRAAIDVARIRPLSEKTLPHLLRHAAVALTGAVDDAHEQRWSEGVAGQLLVITHGLTGLAEKIAGQHAAMGLLGDETKAGWATRATTRQELREMAGRLTQLIDRAEGADTGTDAHALAEWWGLQRTLLEV